MYRNVRKDANLCVFPMACGSGGSTSRLAKAAGAEPCGRGERKNRTPLWREAHFQAKRYKTQFLGPLLEVGMWKNGMPLWPEAHFQVKMLRIRTDGFRALFEDGMWKSGTALRREAHV